MHEQGEVNARRPPEGVPWCAGTGHHAREHAQELRAIGEGDAIERDRAAPLQHQLARIKTAIDINRTPIDIDRRARGERRVNSILCVLCGLCGNRNYRFGNSTDNAESAVNMQSASCPHPGTTRTT